MSGDFSYPLIDPTTFDLVVVGTGLPESIIAAAASSLGKTVLHVDPNPFYGSNFSSLPSHDLTSFLDSLSSSSSSSSSSTPLPPLSSSHSTDDLDYASVHLATGPLYSHVDVTSYCPDVLQEHSRKFNIDLAGPRVLLCADKCIDMILKSGASQYLEFKSIDASYVCDDHGMLSSVPDSRTAIFKDKSLGLKEKNQLMRFFKMVQQHLDSDTGGERLGISEEDLETPFFEFLNKMQLPPKIKKIILYAIAMVEYDQEDVKGSTDIVKTTEGINCMAMYHSSVGRFANAPGAMIYPLYGQGELAQAFCRRAAVKGCLYNAFHVRVREAPESCQCFISAGASVLRMPVVALLGDKHNGQYKGVRLASGQDIFSHDLVLDPSFIVPSPFCSSPPSPLKQCFQDLSRKEVKGKVARGICIASCSLMPDALSCLVIYPPKTLFPEQVRSIRVLQIGGNLAVCPLGMSVIYISTACDEAEQGKKILHAAVDAIISLLSSRDADSHSPGEDGKMEDVKPPLLWSTSYIQEIPSMGSWGSIYSSPMPDGNINYDDILEETLKLFQKMYPQEEFFPETSLEKTDDDEADLYLDS